MDGNYRQTTLIYFLIIEGVLKEFLEDNFWGEIHCKMRLFYNICAYPVSGSIAIIILSLPSVNVILHCAVINLCVGAE